MVAVTRSQVRFYAKPAKKSKDKGKEEKDTPPAKHSKKGGVSTDDLVPASQRIVSSDEYKKTEGKMQTVLEWFRKEVAALETRATGRVTPALLSPVRVKVPGGSDSRGVRLEEVATVGVKEGTTLLVTVFEEHVSPRKFLSISSELTRLAAFPYQTLKSVEQAIYEAKIPGITPQRLDSRTIKLPIPK